MHSKEIRDLALHHRKNGKSYGEIGTILNISRYAAKGLCNYNLKKMKYKTGPKRIIKSKDATKIKKFIRSQNYSGVKVNCSSIIGNLDLDVSRRTLNNFLMRSEFHYKKISSKICLSKFHKMERLRIISTWVENNVNFESVIFTDEKRFTLDGPDNWLVYSNLLLNTIN